MCVSGVGLKVDYFLLLACRVSSLTGGINCSCLHLAGWRPRGVLKVLLTVLKIGIFLLTAQYLTQY